MTKLFRAVLALLMLATAFAVATPSAQAVTCTYDGILSGPGERTSSATEAVQMVALAPYGVSQDNSMDRPMYCDDGSFIKSKMSKSSINAQHWQYLRNSGTYYRFDAHYYTSPNHWERSVRRWSDSDPTHTESWYEAGGACAMLDRARTELRAHSFTLDSNTMYMVLVLGTDIDGACAFVNVTGTSPYKYGVSPRNDASDPPVSYGYSCADRIGDVFWAHEITHMMYADHVTSPSTDLMYESTSTGFIDDPTPTNLKGWNTGSPSYGTGVINRAYSVEPAQSAQYYRTDNGFAVNNSCK